MLKMLELIQHVRQGLLTTHSCQKSRTNHRCSEFEFPVGNLVLLKVSLWKSVIQFRKRGKMGPQVYWPFHSDSSSGQGDIPVRAA